MCERMITTAWWMLTMSLVTATAMAAVMSAYMGLVALAAAQWAQVGVLWAVTAGASFIAYRLCQYRQDLVGD